MGFIYMVEGPTSAPKLYIGQTTRHYQRRFIEHACMKGCPLIHEAIVKYGRDHFRVECLMEVDDAELETYESAFIKELNTMYPAGYNLTSGGEEKKQVHPDVLAKIKAAVRRGPEHHWYQNNGWTGKTHSEDTKNKMRTSMKAVYTEDRRDLVVERNKKRKTNDLPTYISYKRDDAGVIVGYQVQSKKKLFPFKSFADRSLSMEEKLQQAEEYLAAHMS